MSADIRKRVKSKRPSGSIYRPSDITHWEIFRLHSTRNSRRSNLLRCHGRGYRGLDKAECGPAAEKVENHPTPAFLH
jgi:hypothetical protein